MTIAWDDLRYFLEVQRAGSLTRAGVTLGADQSTVGRRLSAFEAKLGARLFFRTPDGFVATPAGERLLPRALQIEEEVQAVAREISGEEARLTGTVRLTAPHALGARIVAPLLVELGERWPEIDLELITDDRFLSLSRREADMAVRVGRPVGDPSLVARKLCALGNGVYAARRYVERYGRPGPGFQGHRIIASEGSPIEDAWVARNAPGARVVLRSNSTAVQVEAVEAGMGIALLSSYHFWESTTVMELVSPKRLDLQQELWLVLHRDLQHNARIRACADFLVEALLKLTPRLSGVGRRSARGAQAC
jgi:DNA-binding transcriptional LysR family regulator